VYDPVSDAVYRFRWGGRNLMETLSLEKDRWSTVDLDPGNDLNRDQSVIDVKGRSIYAISR